MMELRDQESIDQLLERFYGFHDTLLLGVFLFLPHEEDRKATIRVWAEEDGEEGGTRGSGRWLVVEFHVNRVHAYKFEHGPKMSSIVLKDLRVHLLSDGCFLDLSPWTDSPSSEDEIRRSYQYVAGATCWVEIEGDEGR